MNLNYVMANIYELRAEAGMYDIPNIVKYVYSNSLLINPFMMAYGYLREKYPMCLWFAFMALLNFGVDASKSALFFPCLFIIFSFVYKKQKIDYTILLLFFLC
ncbi:hypothetical protein FZ041_06075 [Selenomonas caprae]|uniref:Uncharacterized protein n=1 Tax=Selenomonas caprae TaxID=2606905 RepID=A0A5D6WPS5_9FIRM|nr:hypothetical protein [Selenomonas caprae]TYZ29109.1 hypothetical protein FZ041_06075 [Selenomonas caprae]